MANDLVLVTGGSGFLGSHCLLATLKAGYRARTTIRSLARADSVREMLRVGGADENLVSRVEFAAADLMSDKGWDAACKSCTYILHTASPFPNQPPKDEDELIEPAREGTLRVLRAAKAAGTVERVVLTASTASIVYGHSDSRLTQGPFTEADHTDLDNPSSPVPAYAKSKTLAERAAWDYLKTAGKGMELTTIHPCGIYGPLLSKNVSTSVSSIVMLLTGQMPLLPQLGFGVVDVRDVASLHLLAMTHSKAAGERFLAVGDEYIDVPALAGILREELGEGKTKGVPRWTAPNWLLRVVGLFDQQVGMLSGDLGKKRVESNAKAKEVLGWKPRGQRGTVLETVESLQSFGLVESS